MELDLLIKRIIQCAYNVHMQLPAGFLESVYQKALLIELKKKGLHAEGEMPISVYYDDCIVGEYRADIVVENKVIVELKAVANLLPVHEAQLVNYLTATKIDDGVLINFGSEHIEVKRKYRLYKKV